MKPNAFLRRALATASVMLVAGCARRDTPEHTAARQAAHRDACIATELMIAGRTRAASTDTLIAGGASEGPMASMMRATHSFATAGDAHATARARELAYRDSALSVTTSGDSVRFANEAANAAPVVMPGTVEANAAAKWMDDFSAARANPDHPCNRPDEDAT